MTIFDSVTSIIKKSARRIAAREPVPKDRHEAAAALAVMGGIRRHIDKVEADLEAQIAALRQQAEELALPHLQKYNGLDEALAIFAEANRDELTDHGKTQSVDLGSGELVWRKLPPSVKLKGIDDIIAAIQDMADEYPGMTAFLRVKTEVNKEAMLANPDDAARIPGVAISSEGEVLKILPLVEELSAAQQVKPRSRKAA